VKRSAWLAALIVLVVAARLPGATIFRNSTNLAELNRCLRGHVDDYTHNHGADRRIWSDALQQPRDLYVYLPPGYDPLQQYPVMIWLHGFAQDEQSFLKFVVRPLDRAIACGKLPPLIVAAPDGSLEGGPCLVTAGSFFINSKAGAFEDYVMQDVWNFVRLHYPTRPEREAHILAGVSMGGGAAFNLAIKHRDQFKVVLGILPPLNGRWLDCHCRYHRPFSPCCWGWRTDYSRRHEVIGRFYVVVCIPLNRIMGPLYDPGPDTWMRVSMENPIEQLDRYDLREGELSMYVGYAGRDQFNIEAQVESFLYRAHQRGLTVAVTYDPKGRHDVPTAEKMFPATVAWLAPQIAPYSPLLGNPLCAPPPEEQLETTNP
jgi:S-formylglutathione hydrolase FrmB